METIEIENQVAKDQIAFDLDNLPKEQEREEKSIALKTTLSPQQVEWVRSDVLFVIVDCEIARTLSRWLDCEMCGKHMLEWVTMVASGCDSVEMKNGTNLFEKIKALDTQKPYIIVLFSDTPLVTKEIAYKYLDYFATNRLNAISLPRGYIFRTEYLKTMQGFATVCPVKFDEKAFTRVVDAETFTICNNTLRDRIFDYHEKNGAKIVDRDYTVIDADVVIESGVVVHKCNVIKGETIIEKNTILEEGNKIANSIVGEDCRLFGCRVYESVIGKQQIFACQDFIGEKVFRDKRS